jgi:hypothetical protein
VRSLDARLAELGRHARRELSLALREQFAGLGVDDVVREDAAEQVFVRHLQLA